MRVEIPLPTILVVTDGWGSTAVELSSTVHFLFERHKLRAAGHVPGQLLD